jgi:hypothetical protein
VKGVETPGEVVQYFHVNDEYERHGQMTFLAIYISLRTTNRPLEIRDRPHERISMRTVGGEQIKVEYYDSMWQLNTSAEPPSDRIRRTPDGYTLLWNTDNFHSVLFSFSGYSIFIQACRYADVDRNELIRIAQSFTE